MYKVHYLNKISDKGTALWTEDYALGAAAQDADAMTAAFKEYAAKSVKKQNRPSILAKLEQFKNLIKSAVVDRTKKKEHER